MKSLLSLTLFLLCSLAAMAQTTNTGTDTIQYRDTVLLMSGKHLVGKVYDTVDQRLRVMVPGSSGKPKLELVDQDLVFSVKYGLDSREVVFYKQDTLFGNYFTPQEVRVFMMGENDARNGYHCPLWTYGSVAACGAAGLFLSPVIAIASPFAVSGISVFPRIKIQPSTVSNPEYLKYDTYILGYEKEARKRRLFRALIGGVSGFAVGLTGAIILSK